MLEFKTLFHDCGELQGGLCDFAGAKMRKIDGEEGKLCCVRDKRLEGGGAAAQGGPPPWRTG